MRCLISSASHWMTTKSQMSCSPHPNPAPLNNHICLRRPAKTLHPTALHPVARGPPEGSRV